MKILNSQSGVSIVEASVMLTLLGISAMLFANLLSGSVRATKDIQSVTDFATMSLMLERLLADDVACSTSLYDDFDQRAAFNPDASLATLPQNKRLRKIRVANHDVASVGQIFPTFKINDMKLEEKDPSVRAVAASGKTRYLAEMTIEAERTSGNRAPLKKKLLMWVTTDDSNSKIASCPTVNLANISPTPLGTPLVTGWPVPTPTPPAVTPDPVQAGEAVWENYNCIGAPLNGSVVAPNGNTLCRTGRTIDDFCIAKGHTSALGGCRGYSVQRAANFFGSMKSHTYSGGAMSCFYSAGDWADNPTQVLCMH